MACAPFLAPRPVWLALVAALSVAGTPSWSFGQGSGTVNAKMTVAEQVVVTGVRNLDFGDVLADSGPKLVALTDNGAGIFEINGRSNRDVTVTLAPGTVILENGSGDQITYSVQAAYQNNGAGSPDPGAATPFTGTTVQFRIDSNSGPSQQKSAWIFLYGSISIGRLPPGEYTGELTLTAEY